MAKKEVFSLWFEVPGRLPGLNEYINASKRHRGRDNAGNILKRECQALISAHIPRYAKGQLYDKPVHVSFTFWEANRKRDPDNISAVAHKFILDALVQDKVLKNDGMNIVRNIDDTWLLCPESPRIEVSLYGIPGLA